MAPLTALRDEAGPAADRLLRDELRRASYPMYVLYGLIVAGYTYLRDVWTVNPNTSAAWTQTEVNGLEAGYKRVS